MTVSLRSIGSFLRWRLVPVRYAGKAAKLRLHHFSAQPKSNDPRVKILDSEGYIDGPTATDAMLQELVGLYQPRVPERKPDGGNSHPFINLVQPEDLTPENPVMKLAFSSEVLDVAREYFGGRLRLDGLQVLNSFATGETLKESQKWHLDYADSKSLHCVMYLNDVLTPDDGPFVFVNKDDTRRFGRSLIIRRIEDTQFDKELGEGQVRTFYGEAGKSVLIDPAACYHYGSRCKNARLAVFITFNSDAPFVQSTAFVRENAQRILSCAKALRPDLDDGRLERMLNVSQ